MAIAEHHTPTAMAREIAEIPERVEQLLKQEEIFATLATRIRGASPRAVVLCGRGSSGHVGVFLRYLVEARLGLLVSTAAPSVFTAYRKHPDLHNALFIVISQSGRSPDLVATTQIARELGALTLAIVNDEDSPAATASELVLPIGAGRERAVAATKTVALSMVASALLVSALTQNRDMINGLHRLPSRLDMALTCDWSAWGDRLLEAPAAFVAARGYGFGSAREIALKLTETLRLPALGYSAAELRHGPRAAITQTSPVLVLRQNDEAAEAVDDLVRDLRDANDVVFCAGGPHGTLPWIGDDDPVCDPIAMLLPAYRTIEKVARQRGVDPDNPPHLSKVTRTL